MTVRPWTIRLQDTGLPDSSPPDSSSTGEGSGARTVPERTVRGTGDEGIQDPCALADFKCKHRRQDQMLANLRSRALFPVSGLRQRQNLLLVEGKRPVWSKEDRGDARFTFSYFPVRQTKAPSQTDRPTSETPIEEKTSSRESRA